MPNLPPTQQRALFWLTGFALSGFLALSFLAFHQPSALSHLNPHDAMTQNPISPNPMSANAITQNSDKELAMQPMASHSHHHAAQQVADQTDQPSNSEKNQPKKTAANPTSAQQNSRLIDALLVMGGLGCH